MAKRILQKLLVFVVVMGILSLLCMASGMSTDMLVTCLTFVALTMWSWIVLNDPIEKLFWYRYAFTKQYVFMMALFAGALIAFAVSYCTDSFALGLTAIILFAVMQIAGIGLYVYYYHFKKDTYVCFEIERMKWVKTLSKLRNMTRKEIEEATFSNLRFYPKRCDLERLIVLSDPVDPEGKNRTLTEMAIDNSPCYQERCKKMQEIVDAFCEKYDIK